MITLNDVYKVFTTEEMETYALNRINLHVEKGDFVSIMGPSGCGKTTLLNIVGHLDSPTKGKILIEGVDTCGFNDKELAGLRNEKFGFIFQSFHLINSLNVLQNVELPLLYSNYKLSAKEIREKSMAAIEKVGLAHRSHHLPSQLSGGQCQRAAIARAIVTSPHILLADEPTGNLDSKMGREIMDILLALNAEGTTVVMVTHDSALAGEASTEIVMNDGAIVSSSKQ